MTINRELVGKQLTIALEGRLDTSTAPELESVAAEALDGVEKLIIDMKNLEYVSSAGLRVLLKMQKTMKKNGEMVVRNVGPEIMEVLDITGFSDILTIE